MATEQCYPDGSVYRGQWDDQGQRSGQGLLTLADGTTFLGNFLQGFYSGSGVINYPGGAKYSGDFLHGKFSGFGVFVKADGCKFEGQFEDGEMKGQGCVTFADGSCGLPRNEGYFEDGRMVRQERCPRVVAQAREAAIKAIEASRQGVQ